MKKLFLIGTAVLGMFFMTTSCLDNTEPAGIEAMREARAELIRAEAEYQAALTAYQQAQLALIDVQVQSAQLDNQLKELEIQRQQLELDLQEAQNEHEIRMMELEYLLAQEQNNAEIAELQMQIAELELRQLQLEIDMQELENQKELLMQQHELELLNLQQAIARAQLEYEQALRALEALEHSLTPEEQSIINGYVARISELEPQLADAQDELTAAQAAYVDAKYDYTLDSALLYKRYERRVALAQAALDDANAELAEAQALDFSNEEALLAQKADIESQITSVQESQDSLQMLAADMRLELEEPQAVLDGIASARNDLQAEIDELTTEIQNMQSPENVRTTRSLEVPDAIAHFVGQAFASIKTADYYYYEVSDPNNPLNPSDPDYNKRLIFESDFVVNPETARYELPSGTVTWSTVNGNHRNILYEISQQLHTYDLSEPEKIDYQNRIDVFKAYNEIIMAEYNYLLGILPEAVEEWKSNYAIYTEGIGLDQKAVNAYNSLAAITDLAAEANESNVTALVDAIRYEQQIRYTLSGSAESNWQNFTYDNLTNPEAVNPITLEDLFNAVNNIQNYPVYDYYNGTPNYYDSRYGVDTADWSAANRWEYASSWMYALPYYDGKAFTPEYVGYGEYFIFSYYPENILKSSGVVYYVQRDMKGILNSLGYIDEYSQYVYDDVVNIFMNTNFLKTVWYEAIIAASEDHLANMPLFPEVNASIEDLFTVLNEENDANTEELKVLYDQLRELYVKMDTLNVQYLDQQAVITALNDEIDALVGTTDSEWAVLDLRIDRLEAKLNIFNGILNGTTVVVNDVEYNLAMEDIDLDQLKADWIEEIEEEIKGDGTEFNPGLEYELLEAQQILKRLEDGEDPVKVNLEEAETRLARAKAAYDSLLEKFNYWNDLLSNYIASLTGSQTPEA